MGSGYSTKGGVFTLTPDGNQSRSVNTISASTGGITGLSFESKPSTTYAFNGFVRIGCDNTGGVKVAINAPTGSTMTIGLMGSTTSSTLFSYNNINATLTLNATAYCQELIDRRQIRFTGTLTTSTTGGTIQFFYAPSTNGQTATIYEEGSYMRVEAIG